MSGARTLVKAVPARVLVHSLVIVQRPHVDIAVVTILPEEYAAVHTRLRSPRHEPGTLAAPNPYGWELGWIDQTGGGAFRIVLALAGRAGNVTASQVTIEIARTWAPRYVLLVGIAGGFARDQCALGDVVVSSVIYAYEYGKLGASFESRPNFVYRPDEALLNSANRFAAICPTWGSRLGSTSPKMIAGVVASGEKVIDDPSNKFFEDVQRVFPKIQAVEMEGAGAASAIEHLKETQTIGFLMVRGISDMPKKAGEAAQSTERDATKKRACAAAAEFTARWIADAWPVMPAMAESPPAPAISAAAEQYDLFVAHPPELRPQARALQQLMVARTRTFAAGPTDSHEAVSQALRTSRVVVALASTDTAWLRVDPLASILADRRPAPNDRPLVVIRLDPAVVVPPDLRATKILDVDTERGLAHAAVRLREILAGAERES
jgi:nucleoside phosphorylase